MDLSIRINIELDEATNYIPMGFWDIEFTYVLSDLGIPFVKLKDSTTMGFSVYALMVNVSTKGLSPIKSIGVEWKLIPSDSFKYMQQAYIEKLQADIIEATKIDVDEIVVRNLKTKNSTSEKAIIEIIGDNNTFSMKDENGNIKLLITPKKIGTVAQYFEGTGGGSSSAFIGLNTYSSSTIIERKYSTSLPVTVSDGQVFQIRHPSIGISATADNFSSQPPVGEPVFGMVMSTVRVYLQVLKSGSVIQSASLGSVFARALQGEYGITDEITIPEGKITVTEKGSLTVRLMAQSEIDMFQGAQGSASGKTINNTGLVEASALVNRSELGLDGMMIANSSSSYTYMTDNDFEVRRGSQGLRVTQQGYQKWNGSSWVLWTP